MATLIFVIASLLCLALIVWLWWSEEKHIIEFLRHRQATKISSENKPSHKGI